MGIFNGKNKDGNLKIQMAHIQGLPQEKGIYYLILDKANSKIVFKDATNKKTPETTLSIDKIKSLSYATEDVVKKANTIGRAITGGILFGGTGAIVGAVSAKDKTKTEYYKVINYVSNGSEKSIVLKSRTDFNEHKFFKQLAEMITPASENSLEPIEL